jgi:hypothetical protein
VWAEARDNESRQAVPKHRRRPGVSADESRRTRARGTGRLSGAAASQLIEREQLVGLGEGAA